MSGIRMGGIASGMDTESIVQQLVSSRRTRVDYYERMATKNEWKTEAYNEVNQNLANFILNSRKNLGLTDVDYFGNLRQNSIDKVDWANKATSSDDKIIGAVATSSAIAGKYSIVVKSLAETATVVGKSLKKTGAEESTIKFSGEKIADRFDSNSTIGELMEGSSVLAGGSFQIEVNGRKVTLNTNDTIKQAVEKISSEADVKVTFDETKKIFNFESNYSGATRKVYGSGGESYTVENKITFGQDNATSLFFARVGLSDTSDRKYEGASSVDVDSSTKLRDLSLGFDTDGEGKFTINLNGKSVELNTSMTVDDAIKAIKNSTDININFDNGSKMLFMSTKGTGSTKTVDGKEVDNSIKFGKDNNTVEFFEKLGITDQKEVVGKDAVISFNGSQDISYSSNNISINGLNLTLNNVSEMDASGSYKKDYVTVTTNVDGIFNKVKEFVEEYNKIIDQLQSMLNEKAEKDYQPLTKAERGELKEEEVKLWDEKAKSGLLRDDKVIRRMISDIRSALYEQVNTTFDAEGKNEQGTKIGFMFELGITTASWKEGAKLKIDESKLKSAIAEDPNKVLNILFQASDDKRVSIKGSDSDSVRREKNSQIANRRSENGVFVRIMDSINKGMENIINHAGTGKNSDLLTQVNNNIMMSFRTTQGSISTLGKDMNQIDKFLDRELKNLNSYEESLWAKFTAMEKAIAKAQEQSGWLMQQMGM